VSDDRSTGVEVEVRSVWKRYGDFTALRDVSLRVAAGQFVSVLGPSGGGKTTLLNTIAGFVAPSEGAVLFDGHAMAGVPVYRRNLGVVFQSYALFPHMTALENVMFPLVERRVPTDERRRRSFDALRLVGLEERGDRRPSELSGGQQQRVALARAIVFEPGLLLMDEPLGALERTLRASLQTEIKRIHRQLGATVLYVTHDPQEALELSDVIAVMHDGGLEQVGSPQELWTSPVSQFVALALGECNAFEGTLDGHGRFIPSSGSGAYALDAGNYQEASGHVFVLVRPERMVVVPLEERSENRGGDSFLVDGRVTDVDFSGSTRRLVIESAQLGRIVVTELVRRGKEVQRGDAVVVSWCPADCCLVPQ
jgi:putative spermidine/putrescine transport system ATP-binding protein